MSTHLRLNEKEFLLMEALLELRHDLGLKAEAFDITKPHKPIGSGFTYLLMQVTEYDENQSTICTWSFVGGLHSDPSLFFDRGGIESAESLHLVCFQFNGSSKWGFYPFGNNGRVGLTKFKTLPRYKRHRIVREAWTAAN